MKSIELKKDEVLRIKDSIHEYTDAEGDLLFSSYGMYYSGSTYNIVGYKTTNCIVSGNTITAQEDANIELYFLDDLKGNNQLIKAVIGYDYSGQIKLKGFDPKEWD